MSNFIHIPNPLTDVFIEFDHKSITEVHLARQVTDFYTIKNAPVDEVYLLREAIDFLQRYFAKEPVLWNKDNLGDASDFTIKVRKALCEVPFGKTVSYGELAKLAGSPKAARAVGGVMATNKLPLLIPCHRVIAANGGLGGFFGGLDLKRKILCHEGIDC